MRRREKLKEGEAIVIFTMARVSKPWFWRGVLGKLQLSKVFQDGDAKQVGWDEANLSIMRISCLRYSG